MVSPIAGEQFVRTLRHYLEANQNRLLYSSQTIIEEDVKEPSGILKAVSSLWSSSRTSNTTSSKESSLDSRPTSLYGYQIPYMSLLSATSPNATCLSNTPYMPLRSSLTLDFQYLYFLLVQFEYLGLENTHLPVPENGLVETETTTSIGQAPSIVSSVGSVMSTLSLSTGWQLWQKDSHRKQPARPLHEDIVYIHRYFSKISALKLHMNGVTKTTIKGYETPVTISLPLHTFKSLTFLELNHIPPSLISNWSELKETLVSLVIKHGQIDNAVDVIGDDVKWSQLKMLSLADNSLTTLDAEPTNMLRSLTHLNLSSNLLIDIPSALATLYNLYSLNLSHNMISFTTGINTVLGNIQELDLRGNRLTLLAGLDRLYALERLDVRDNRIEDAAEIGRLTDLPNIQDIWVEGNPFTQIQPDYRVEIFNLFKKGDQDIELDGTKPTFTEKRRIQTNTDHHNTPSAAVVEESVHPTSKWPNAVHSEDPTIAESPTIIPKTKLARTKTKGNKRIIRLGRVENKNEAPILSDDEETRSGKYVHRLAELEDAVQQEQVMARRAASVRSRRSKKAAHEDESPVESTSESTRRSSDAFRRKIEAMRKEAGVEWLRVLQEMDVVKKSKPATPDKQ
ncbi:hypothetical protein EDC94DRAFT_550737 [Helicostylum pulchrum]|uniref:Uncharacterized protein n=1 Tax=Helicostylum pulchrum TaxID=562976 RepID=A0ABP9Y717_9FUNG|nr:hypothetical protein EDC94DRAFT_550737 [Helicostylum pulchrum]